MALSHRHGVAVSPVPAYMAGRVERGGALPKLGVRAVVEWLNDDSEVDEESMLLQHALKYVLHGMSGALFVEWLEVWGRWRD
jgi:hypothetical protein